MCNGTWEAATLAQRRPPGNHCACRGIDLEGTRLSQSDDVQRQVLPIPDRQHVGPDHLRRQGPRHGVPADRAAAPAGRRAQRARGAPGRRGLRSVQRVRRPVPDPDRRAPGRRRPEVQPLPHHRTLLAHAPGAPHRPQPPLGRNGGITEIATSAPGYSSVRPDSCAPLPETLKLNGYSTAQFGKCHEVPVWETSPLGRFASGPPAAASSTSTASSAARPTSTTPPSTRAPRRSSRPRPRTRATTSPRT